MVTLAQGADFFFLFFPTSCIFLFLQLVAMYFLVVETRGFVRQIHILILLSEPRPDRVPCVLPAFVRHSKSDSPTPLASLVASDQYFLRPFRISVLFDGENTAHVPVAAYEHGDHKGDVKPSAETTVKEVDGESA